MFRPERISMTAFSILDLCPIVEGGTTSEALASTRLMAKQAEENRALMERLGQMDIDLQERERAIKSREEEMLQLQQLLKEKDDNLSRLKGSVANALLGFKAKD